MTERPSLVFLLDVDNTLFDNDGFKAEIDRRLRSNFGPLLAEQFWGFYEEVRQEYDYVDYPETASRLASSSKDPALREKILNVLHDIPLDWFIFSDVFETLRYLRGIGTPVILSDGDQVYQRWKIEQSGLADAVANNVLIYVHKEEHLDEVFVRFPARHYVMVDDKPRILSALERTCPSTFTTILVLQGKYARMADYATRPDWVVPSISDLRHLTVEEFTAEVLRK